MQGDERHRLQRREHQEHGGQVPADVRHQQASLAQLGRGGAAAGQRPDAGGVQVQPFQHKHGEEEPRLAAGDPGSCATAGPELASGESDRPAGDVGIAAGRRRSRPAPLTVLDSSA